MKKKKLKKMLKAALAAVAGGGQKGDGRTVNQWIDVYEREIAERGYSPQTVSNKRTILAHCRRLWGEREIAALKPLDISAGIRSFPRENSSTAGRVLREMRQALTVAIENGWSESNPAAVLKSPAHTIKRKRLRFEVWQAMLSIADSHPQRWIRPMLLLAIITGQRRGDLVRMRFTDVITDATDGQQYLRVEQEKKAGKKVGARLEIPLALRLDAIGMSLGEVIEECRAYSTPGETMLRKSNGTPLEKSSLSTRFHELIVAVEGLGAYGPREWPSLHEARSLCARAFKAQGAATSGQAVNRQGLLGHKKEQMTEVYENDRGLSDGEWKRVDLGNRPIISQPEQDQTHALH